MTGRSGIHLGWKALALATVLAGLWLMAGQWGWDLSWHHAGATALVLVACAWAARQRSRQRERRRILAMRDSALW